MRKKIRISTEYIKLDSLLKLCGESVTGGGAKEIILSGRALVNGAACLERGKKIRSGDIISVNGREYEIAGAD